MRKALIASLAVAAALIVVAAATGRSTARSPISSVRPMIVPFLMPPPAIHMENPQGL